MANTQYLPKADPLLVSANAKLEEGPSLAIEKQPRPAIEEESTAERRSEIKDRKEGTKIASGPVSEPVKEARVGRGAEAEPRRAVADGVESQQLQEGLEAESREAKQKLAIADWSPLNGAGAALEAGQTNGTRSAGARPPSARRSTSPRSTSQQMTHSVSSSEATESDFEKEAAEMYIEKSRQQPSGTSAKAVPRKQRSPLPRVGEPPKKVARRAGSHSESRKRSDDESDAIAALEQIKHAGASNALAKPCPSPAALPSGKPNLPPMALLEAASHFPGGALEALARLVQRQPMPMHLRSPFQIAESFPRVSPTVKGQAASPLQFPGAGPVSSGLMRSCFSETSAEALAAKAKKEQSALSTLQAIVETSNGKMSNGSAKHSASLVAPLKTRAASGSLLSLPPTSFPTLASDTATDTVFNLSSVLGHNTKPLATTFGQQNDGEPPPSASTPTIPPSLDLSKANLGAFGSIISNAVDAHFQRSPDALTVKNDTSTAQDIRNSVPETCTRSPQPSGIAQATSSGQADSGRQQPRPMPNSAAVQPVKAQLGPSTLPPAIPGPDPRILDWVLGNRCSLTDRGKNHAPKTSSGPSLANLEALIPRGVVPAAPQPAKPDLAKSSHPNATTIRRPIAIRASEIQDTPQHRARPEAMLDSLFSRVHSGGGQAPPLNMESTPSVSAKLADLAAAAQQTLSASDMGRVMQWAGAELALRDQKVREADKQREEERRAHDAAMNAVGTEVARLKRGQAELAITHWKLQEALSQKDVELREKGKLVQQLSAGLTDITQQGILATKEAQSLRAECEALQLVIQTKDGHTLSEFTALEEALKRGDTSNAASLLSEWRGRLEQGSKEQRRIVPTSSC